MRKVIVSEFKASDLGAVETYLRHKLDLEIGSLQIVRNEEKGTIEAQYFLDKGLNDKQNIIDLLIQSTEATVGLMQFNGIIQGFKGVDVYNYDEKQREE